MKPARQKRTFARQLVDQETLRVQVPNNHILTQSQHYNQYYPKPKYLIIGYMDPLGNLHFIFELTADVFFVLWASFL